MNKAYELAERLLQALEGVTGRLDRVIRLLERLERDRG